MRLPGPSVRDHGRRVEEVVGRRRARLLARGDEPVLAAVPRGIASTTDGSVLPCRPPSRRRSGGTGAGPPRTPCEACAPRPDGEVLRPNPAAQAWEGPRTRRLAAGAPGPRGGPREPAERRAPTRRGPRRGGASCSSRRRPRGNEPCACRRPGSAGTARGRGRFGPAPRTSGPCAGRGRSRPARARPRAA